MTRYAINSAMTKKRFCFRVDLALVEQMKAIARSDERSLSFMVVKAIRAFVAEPGAGEHENTTRNGAERDESVDPTHPDRKQQERKAV